MNNIIEVNGLSKHYPDFSLSEASFTVPEGCITGFVGAKAPAKPPHSVPFSDCWNQTAGKSVCSANRSLLPKTGFFRGAQEFRQKRPGRSYRRGSGSRRLL